MATLSRTITFTVLVCFAWLALVVGLTSYAPGGMTVDQELTAFLVSGIVAAVVIVLLWLRWFFGT